MLPSLRKKLKNVSFRNLALQDILKSASGAKVVKSIEPQTEGVHNTKLILELATGEQRVHFYNRLDLSDIMPGLVIENTELGAITNELNLKGYDFTSDDLFISDDGHLTAKPSSLGYVGHHDQLLISNAEILCEGALSSSEVYLSGLWDVEVDGEIIATNLNNAEIYNLLNA